MRRRKTIGPIPVMASRWTAWAARLTSRHGRLTDLPGLALILPMPALARTLILLQQRWLSAYVRVQPQLNLSISGSSTWTLGARSAHASQMELRKLFSLSIEKSRTQEAEPGARRTGAPLSFLEDRRKEVAGLAPESGPPTAMTLAMARTTAEHLSTTLNRHLSVRRQADFTEVSRLLTQRVQRLNDVSAIHPQMAFRAGASNRVTPQQISSQATPEPGAFGKQSSPQNVPAEVMSALNVELLANQVLKQIDRRVVARRERMGQI